MDQMVVKSQFLMNLTKFVVVSIWVFSIFFSHNFYFSRFTIRLVTHAIDKNYMFLFCNGLLVLVVKYSGLINPEPAQESSGKIDKSPEHRAFESYSNGVTGFDLVQRQQTGSFLAEEETETGDESETVSDNGGTTVVQEPAKDIYVVQEDQNRGNGEEEGTEDGGFEEENVGVMKVEELNQKFEEFIRKMKEELRIEARRQLILV